MPKYKVVMKYEIEYTVDAENEDEAWMMVQEDTEGMTKRYLDEQTLSVEQVKEQPKMKAEGFFIDEEDLEDLIGTWDDAEKALARMDAVKKEDSNADIQG